jgi:hypothetical protein
MSSSHLPASRVSGSQIQYQSGEHARDTIHFKRVWRETAEQSKKGVSAYMIGPKISSCRRNKNGQKRPKTVVFEVGVLMAKNWLAKTGSGQTQGAT